MGAMAYRPKHTQPPYEVMIGEQTTTTGASHTQPDPGLPDATGQRVSGETRSSRPKSWSSEASHPIVLRIPRGLAVLIVSGIFGLIFLAYWVGYSRNVAVAQSPTPTANARPLQAHDQREAGLYYHVLVTYPGGGSDIEKQASRLVGYLHKRGIETTTIGLENGGLRVIDLMGFRDLTGDTIRVHAARLHEIGQTWKNEYNGLLDFSKMYAEQYTQLPIRRLAEQE